VIGTLPELIPVPFGRRDWLGPRLYADEYAEIGHAPQSVSFCEVMVDRQSLLGWLTTVSTKAPQLREADVTKLVLGEKMNPSVSIAKIVTLVQAKDPLFPREQIREIARKSGVEGKREPSDGGQHQAGSVAGMVHWIGPSPLRSHTTVYAFWQ
jgi:hypothetical protein